MADAGIVRNRAKVLATITNARATLALRDDPEGDLAAFVWSFRPADTPRPHTLRRRAHLLAGVAGPVQGAQAQGLRVRRAHDDVRADGGGRHRRHPPARLAPARVQRGLAGLRSAGRRSHLVRLGHGSGTGSASKPQAGRTTARPGNDEGPDATVRPFDPVELRGFEPLTPCMPCRCATNCATAPSGCPPKGRRRVYPCTTDCPNPPQGGGRPGHGRHLRRRVPGLDPPPGAALDELGPVAVAQGAEHPPGDVVLEPEQPGGGGAARRAVRGHDEALPRPERVEVLGERGTDPLGDLGQRLAGVAPARVLTAGQGRLHVGPPVARPAPPAGPARRPRRSRGSAGRAPRGCRTRAPTLCAVSARPGQVGGDDRGRLRGQRSPAPRHPPAVARARTAGCRGGPARCGPRCGRSRRAAAR